MSAALENLPFKTFTWQDWKALADKELQGKSFEEYLVWKSADGFEMQSYQDQLPELLAKLPPLKQPWQALEYIGTDNAGEANRQALSALMSGAEAIWFDHPFQGEKDKTIALDKIDTAIAPVFINGVDVKDPFEFFLKSGSETKPVEAADQNLILNGSVLRERGAGIIEEIALVITQALEVARVKGPDQHLVFKLAFGTSYLAEIAKLRAFRWLWAGILNEWGKPVSPPEVIAVNLDIDYTQNDEYTNILRATSSCMSAVIGGARFVMVKPWDLQWKDSDAFSSRISRNIQNLLRDEACMDKNLNPADGSYLIEHLTLDIAHKAWDLVRQIESEGGFSVFAKSQKLRKMLEASAKATVEKYKTHKTELLGITKFRASAMAEERAPKKEHYALLPEYLHLPSILHTP